MLITFLTWLGMDPLAAEAFFNVHFNRFLVFLGVLSLYLVKLGLGKWEDKCNTNYSEAAIGTDPQANARVVASVNLSNAIFWGLAIMTIF